MPHVERTISTSASPEQVWAYLSDFTTTEQWDPPTRSTVREQGQGGVGTIYRNISAVLGKEVEVEYTVLHHEPPRRLQLQGQTSSSMRMLDTITVRPHEDGCTVTYRAEFYPQGAAKLAQPLLPAGLKKLGDDAAEQMKAQLDALPA